MALLRDNWACGLGFPVHAPRIDHAHIRGVHADRIDHAPA